MSAQHSSPFNRCHQLIASLESAAGAAADDESVSILHLTVVEDQTSPLSEAARHAAEKVLAQQSDAIASKGDRSREKAPSSTATVR